MVALKYVSHPTTSLRPRAFMWFGQQLDHRQYEELWESWVCSAWKTGWEKRAWGSNSTWHKRRRKRRL